MVFLLFLVYYASLCMDLVRFIVLMNFGVLAITKGPIFHKNGNLIIEAYFDVGHDDHGDRKSIFK